MELALAEKSTYLPPLIVGALLFYRIVFTGLMTNHPILKPVAYVVSTTSFIADRILYSITSLMGYTHTKALVVRNTSSALVSTFLNSMSMALEIIQRMFSTVSFQIKNVYQMASNMTSNAYAVVVKTTDALTSIRFQFQTVVFQSYNFTASMFGTLQEKVYEHLSWFSRIKQFFFPPQKTIYDYTTIGVAIIVALIIVGATVNYLAKSRTKTVVLPDVPIQEPPKEEESMKAPRRNPIRRKAKLN